MTKLITAEMAARIDEMAAHADASLASRIDAGIGAYFARELERVLPEVLTEERVPLTGFEIIPVDTRSLAPHDDVWIEQTMTESGRAKLIADFADDLPGGDVGVSETARKVATYGSSAQWSVLDVMRAAATGKSLPNDKLRIATRSIEEQFHDVLWNGDRKAGLEGIFSHADIPRHVLKTNLLAMTAADLRDELNQIAKRALARTKGTFENKQLTLAVPHDLYAHITTTPHGTATDRTILEFILAGNPWIAEIRPAFHVAGAGKSGRDAIFAYRRDPSVLNFKIAMQPQAQPVQAKNLSLMVPMMGRIGGLHVRFPFETEIIEYPAAA